MDHSEKLTTKTRRPTKNTKKNVLYEKIFFVIFVDLRDFVVKTPSPARARMQPRAHDSRGSSGCPPTRAAPHPGRSPERRGRAPVLRPARSAPLESDGRAPCPSARCAL